MQRKEKSKAMDNRNTQVEYAFFGALLDQPTLINEAKAEGANLDWFTLPKCRLLWESIESLTKRKQDKLKALVIIEEAIRISSNKKSPYHGEKIDNHFYDEAMKYRDRDNTGPDEIKAYCGILRDKALGRAADNAYRGTADESSGEARARKMFEMLQSSLKSETGDVDIRIGDILDSLQEEESKADIEYNRNHNYNYIPGIPWPWEDVNHLTNGLQPGLHVVAARPSVGKTSFALQCMNYWFEAGYKVAFACLDMSVTEMIKRPRANLARVSPARRCRGWANDDEKARVRQADAKIRAWENDGLFTITLEADVDKLKAWAEKRREAGKLDVLVIDFAQRFRLKGSHGASEYETVTYVSGVLKQLANECLIPVILLSQLSRDNQKAKDGPRPPELSDLRGSGALEQDATTVVLLHKMDKINEAWAMGALFRPEMRGKVPQGIEDAASELDGLVPSGDDPKAVDEARRSLAAVNYNLAKNQNGACGEVPFIVYQNHFRWFVGDKTAPGSEKYKKLKLDWRADEAELKTAMMHGRTVEPAHWANKYAEECGKLGMSLPDSIRSSLSSWDIERYNKRLQERKSHT